MRERQALIASPRNLFLATGTTELPFTDLVEKDKSRFGSENAKSCLGHNELDIPIWHLDRDAEHVAAYTSLQRWLEIHIWSY